MYADALSTQILQNNESLQAAKLSLKGDELALRTEGNLPDPEIGNGDNGFAGTIA